MTIEELWAAVEAQPGVAGLKRALAAQVGEPTRTGLLWAAKHGKHPSRNYGGTFTWEWGSLMRSAPSELPDAIRGTVVHNRLDPGLIHAFHRLGEAVRKLQSLVSLSPINELDALHDAARQGDRAATAAYLDECLARFGQPEDAPGFVSRAEMKGMLRLCEWAGVGESRFCRICNGFKYIGHQPDCRLVLALGREAR